MERPASPHGASVTHRSSTARLASLSCAALLVVACCGKQRPAATATKPRPQTQQAAHAGILSRPHVTLVAFSDWQSVLKPCGCTEELQRGGIERNARFLADLRRGDDSVLAVHAGSLLVEDEAPRPQQVAQRNERMKTFSAILDRLDMAAVALSSDDLKRGGDKVSKLYQDGKWPLVRGTADHGVTRAAPHRVVTTGSGLKVGLLAVDPGDASDAKQRHALVQERASVLRQQGAQVVVALSNLGMRGSRRLARAAPAVDVVVVGDVPERAEPVEELDPDERALILQAPRHGAFMAVLTIVPGEGERWHDVSAQLPGAVTRLQDRLAAVEQDLARFAKGARKTVAMERALPFFRKQRADLRRRIDAARRAKVLPPPAGKLIGYAAVGLPWSAPVEATIAAEVKRYDARVAALNDKAARDPVPLPKGEAGYVGSAVCLACHVDTAAFSKRDLHSHAWQTLEKGGKTRDLDCVPCHSTGFGKPGGSAFANIDTFKAVQCEACHGPGSLHAGAPEAGAKSRLINKPGEPVCKQCHTPEHAPRFEFSAYHKRLLVPGHGLPVAAP